MSTSQALEFGIRVQVRLERGLEFVFLLKRRKKNLLGVVCATPDRYLSAYRLEQNTGTETGTGVTRRPVANNPFFTPSTLLGISSRVWPGGCNPADIAPGLK